MTIEEIIAELENRYREAVKKMNITVDINGSATNSYWSGRATSISDSIELLKQFGV